MSETKMCRAGRRQKVFEGCVFMRFEQGKRSFLTHRSAILWLFGANKDWRVMPWVCELIQKAICATEVAV